ncbi:putative disease resistance protein At1g63350 [Rosa rugosa]|uniref:putative disease resistance protein At1g63350 n=1 Tax=Rosa rugosa TaxID=74645 RepID=UPI002B4172A4|nr:putative disease resistance protein At1g63350 [Rosa rugosa]
MRLTVHISTPIEVRLMMLMLHVHATDANVAEANEDVDATETPIEAVKADELINGFEPELEAVRISKNCCGLPYYRSRYKAGKYVAARIKQVNVLKSEIKKLINVGESIVVEHMIGSGTKLLGEAARSMVKEIKEYVTGKEVGTIRVYGMAGFGKTAVVSEVNDLIVNDYRSCAPEEKLHIDLCIKPLGVERADTFESALKELRFLIILDDMRKKLSLELIGILPTRENGCKVIIVSRSLPVFSDIKIDKKVEIKPLSDTAARELFEREASIRFSDLRDDTQTMAEKMVDD